MADDEWHPVDQPAADEWKPVGDNQGLLAKGIGMLATPEGRSQLLTGVEKLPADILKGTMDWFETPGKAVSEGLTSDEEISFGFNTALGTIGGKTIPRGVAPSRITIPLDTANVAKQFNDTVAEPAATRLNSFARTGDPNGVRLDPPLPETKPSNIAPIENSPFAGVPRSILAKTGVPEVDSILFHPTVQSVIDNPVVDRTHTIPYEAGGSVPLERQTTYLDEHVPKEFTVNRLSDPSQKITFDPAEPTIIHENTEEFAMDLLTKGGMAVDEAYRVAHFEIAEVAEHAWYTANDIDPAAAEAEWKKLQPGIQHEIAADTPSDLYHREYPGGNVTMARHEDVFESMPTAEEKARAFDILRNSPELRPKSAQPMLQQARELGVIGNDRPTNLNQMPPKEAGRAAMAAGRPPDKIASDELGQPEQTAWRKRWERTLDNMATRDDVRQVIGGIVDANDEFAAARIGDMRPVQIEQIANVTGLDSTKIDIAGTSSKIKSDVELRNFTEAFRIVNDKIAAAADELSAKRGIDDAAEGAKMMQLELQRQLMLDSTVAVKGYAALRAEWGRAGNTLRDFQKSMREAEGVEKIKGIDDLRDRAKLIAETPANARPRVLILSPFKPPPWFFWATQNLLISGPITHAGYSAVNGVELMLDHVIAPLGQQFVNKVRGAPADFGAPLEAYNAIVRSVPEAFKGATLAFKSGQRVPLLSEWELAKRQLENPEAKAAQVPYTSTISPDWGIWKRAFNDEQLAKAERVIGVFGRSANFQHTFFKIMGEKAATAAEAYHTAAAEGLAPSMIDKEGNAQFWSRYQYHAGNLSDEALKRVIDSAYEGTFMEKLGKQTQVFAELARNTPLKWVFMFTHIPMNIARAGVRYSWMAATTLPERFGSDIGAALRGDLGMQAQNLALVKASIGTAVGSYFIHQALAGQSTGDYPTDEKERNRWKVMGIQPNSVLVDGQWHNLERLGPVMGAVPRLAANYAAIIKQYNGSDDESLMKAAWLMALGTAKVVTDDVGFQTVRNIVNAFENPKEAAKEVSYQLASYADSFTMGAQVASEMDPYMREADTIMKGIMMRLPYSREELTPKRDPVFGEPVPNPGFHAAPFRSAPVNTDPIKSELDRIQYYPAAPQRTIGHVKLTDEQYDRYEATAGPLVKQMLTAHMNTKVYQSEPVDQQVKDVKGIISYARAKARAALQMDAPHLIQQGIDARKVQITGATP